MGARPGTNNNTSGGKKGRSGRKSAFQELKCAEMIIEACTKGVDLDDVTKLAEIMKSGKGHVSLTQLAIVRALKSERVLMDLLRKVVPDKILHEGEALSQNIMFYLPDNKREVKKLTDKKDDNSKNKGVST